MGGTIVVGADASGPSRAAIDWAITRSASLDMTVELVHVIDQRWLTFDESRDAEVVERATHLLDAELARARTLGPHASVTGRVVVGQPPRELMAAAHDADLLVIGTHKTGFTYGRAFGSKFLSLAFQSPCALAVIPEFLGRSRRGVVAAAGLDVSQPNVAEFAAAEAARTGEDLILVAVHDSELVAGDRDDRTAEALITASTTASLLVVGRPGGEADDAARAVPYDVLANISSPVIVLDATPKGHHGTQHAIPSAPHLA